MKLNLNSAANLVNYVYHWNDSKGWNNKDYGITSVGHSRWSMTCCDGKCYFPRVVKYFLKNGDMSGWS